MIYFIREKGTRHVKIGFTDRPIRERLGFLQVGNPRELVVERMVEGDLRWERAFHSAALAIRSRIRGEWFELDSDEIDLLVREVQLWAAEPVQLAAQSMEAADFEIINGFPVWPEQY